MGFIYMITNNITKKVYVGQTKTSLNARMNRHYTNAKCNPKATGIDGSIRKYGRNNFSVRIICKSDNQQLDELEKFYIKKFDSNNLSKGYNLTYGGNETGTFLGLKTDEVIQKYIELESIKEVAKYYNCSIATISSILHENNIKIIKKGRIENLKPYWKNCKLNGKPIKIIELNLRFKSSSECARWLIKNNYTYSNNHKNICKQICKVLKGNLKTFHGFTFEYCI